MSAPDEDRWAHRRDPDLDAPAGGGERPTVPEPARPPGASRYGWLVGIVAIAVLVYIALNTLRTAGRGPAPARGELLPPFAVPLLGSHLDGDANVARKPGPGAGRSGRTPACAVRDPRALNICRVAAGHPLVLSLASVRDRDTLRQLDAMQVARHRAPEGRYVAVFLKGDRDEARRDARRHGWTFPLGWDRNADVAAVYGIKALPVVVFADRRRREVATAYRYVPPAAIVRRVRALAR